MTMMVMNFDPTRSIRVILLLVVMQLHGDVSCASMTCLEDEFKCNSNSCIPLSFACDGEDDCGDMSDEVNCPDRASCSEGEFKCKNNRCISILHVCDGHDNCGDMSDEENCSTRTCSEDNFKCDGDRCIPLSFACDGDKDCDDMSDEGNCPDTTCPEDQFHCNNNKCIPFSFVCDGDDDCGDMSDEVNCGGFCGQPRLITHGHIVELQENIVRKYKIGFNITYVCDAKYRIKGNSSRQCISDGDNFTWSGEDPTCEEIFCDSPPTVEHGQIIELQSTNAMKFVYGSSINYVCDEGYRITQGDSCKQCIDEGSWTGEDPICEEILCPDPGTPENGNKRGTDIYSVGSRIQFSCDRGYELLGAEEILCQPDGRWQGELTRCNSPSNDCPDPGTPIMGSKNASEYKIGDSVRFLCHPTTFMFGSEIRKCLPDGTWSGEQTKCVGFDSRVIEMREKDRKEWLILEETVNASDMIVRGILDPSVITVTYFVFDVSDRIPASKFKEGVDFAKSVVREVGVSNTTRFGAVTFASKSETLFTPLYSEVTEEILEALDKIEQIDGETSPSMALTIIRNDLIPLVQEYLASDSRTKSVIFIFSDGKVKIKDGNTKSVTDILKSRGVDVFSIGITCVVKKNVLHDTASRSPIGKERRPSVLILRDKSLRNLVIQEVPHLVNNYSQCGIRKQDKELSVARIVGGKKVVEPWPWVAALNMTQYEQLPTKTVMCGGSVIHRYFILTAAHCVFYYKDGPMRTGSDITVKLGMSYIYDKTHLQEFDVRKIYVHRHFNPSTFDYDIALLELRRPIQFNEFVGPICLPPKEIPEKSPLYKTHSTVLVAGWGHVSMRAKLWPFPTRMTENLKEIALPIQSRDTCKESLVDDGDYYHAFSERMFCAGTGLDRNDACNGDSGGPAMQSSPGEAGDHSWTQVGIVSWGLGCGLEDEFGMYVHLHSLMPWVDETIERAVKFGRLRRSLLPSFG